MFGNDELIYLAPADARSLDIPDQSVDLVCSNVTFEHIPKEVLREILFENARVLKPDGRAVHVVDPSDHCSHSDRSISKLNFLRFTDEQWQAMAGQGLCFHNRLRVPEYKSLVRSTPLEIEVFQSEVDKAAVRDLERFQLAEPRWAKFSEEELAQQTLLMVAQPCNTLADAVPHFQHGTSNPRAKQERHREGGQPLALQKVCYVTMAFPVPSEAFAAVEINELNRQGIDVSVKTIRGKRADHDAVSRQQQVECIPIQHAGWTSPVRGAVQAAIRPRIAVRLWWKLVCTLAHRPFVLIACLFWSFRCFELLAQVRREKPDVTHLYWGHVPSILGWMLRESASELMFTLGLSAYDLEMALPISFDVATKGAAGIRSWATVNEAAISDRGVAPQNIRMIHQGISIEKFTDNTPPAASRSPQRLLFAGRLVAEKGVELAIEVARRLRSTFPKIELVIAGSGPLVGKLQKRIAELGLEQFIFLRGHLAHDELAEELTQAALFLLPSRHVAERLPNVIKEAAAAGCCCLTTASPGIETLIRDGESGRILPPNDVDAWTKAVSHLLAAPDEAREMANEAKQLVAESFSVETTADQLMGWWQGLLRDSSRAQGATP